MSHETAVITRDYKPIDHRVFKELITNISDECEVVLNQTDGGIELTMTMDENAYILYTARNSKRLFKSIETAVGYLANVGVKSVMHKGIDRTIG
ncbi:MAG: hypothetical protein QM500_04515 [Methylococcales bacterium]